MTRDDRTFLEALRTEFNNQPIGERFRTGRFMTYEAVAELLREREHAMQTVRRIDSRVATLLEAERRKHCPSSPSESGERDAGMGGA